MKQSVTVGAQLLWSGRYGCNNGHYGCTIVMSYIEINKAVSQWLLTFNLCVSVTWPLTCAFHMPCTHTPEIIVMHRGMCDNPYVTVFVLENTQCTNKPSYFIACHCVPWEISFYSVPCYDGTKLLFLFIQRTPERQHICRVWIYLEHWNIDGFVYDCSNSIANALELLQFCTKLSTLSGHVITQRQNTVHALNPTKDST